jgi:hypothetical protein
MDFLNSGGLSLGNQPAAPRFIGVPSDYRTAPVQPTSFNYTQSVPRWDSRGPQYQEGQEYKILGNMSEVQRQRVQQAMINAGLLDPSRVRFGLVDPYTVKAFEAVLGQATLPGASWSQMLFSQQGAESLGALGGGGGGGGGGRAPLTTRVTSPATLRRVFRQAMVDAAGSRVEGFDIEAAVQAYQAAEAQFQQQAYGMAESGGTLTEPPDAQTFIADQLDAKAGVEVQSNSIAERAGQLLGMLDGGF